LYAHNPTVTVTEELNFSNRSKPSFMKVEQEQAGQRLDNFLFSKLKGVPKSRIYQMIRKGELRINKGRVKQTTRLKADDLIRLPPLHVESAKTVNVSQSLESVLQESIVFEDKVLMVLNKPSGIAVHAGSGVRTGLIEALRKIRSDLPYLELVHRLDRETSGCLVLAKRASALRALHREFQGSSERSTRLDKRYVCLVKGQWQHGQRRIEKPLDVSARHQGERHVIVSEQGRYACSIMRPVSRNKQASLIEVKLMTGRTHQVRVHAQSENHPIAGDKRYGDAEFNVEMGKLGLHRLFLHSNYIAFPHPVTEQLIEINAPLPRELKELLGKLNLEDNLSKKGFS
jgi:23S rRNA pseudouridine955/2504/2580 synthase